ncbi:MAG TPA: hypothetical protein VFW23_01280, partial [Tepidisphaeraceae bacterium]|nr:hypothetical protein [Tepidisphaeraceae bacterium]
LTRLEQSAASLVVPLSIAYQTRPQFVALRKEMGRIPGRWRFAFFDREPHALFGEDVKTRNAIVFHRRGGLSNAAIVLETGPLRRWTSRSRAAMFANIRFTPLQRLEITFGIPKVDGESQARALNLLERRSDRISDLWLHSGRASAADAFLPSEQSTVFVASTAYNFINVFRPHQQPRSSRLPLTENPLLAIECADERVARAIFAILSSRIIFWWWHTHGDGFHVTKTFIEGIPLGSQLSSETIYRLSDAGEQLWRAVQPFRIRSLNGGRESVAYRPIHCEVERDEIDRIIIAATGLDPTFADEVRRFVWSTVVVDGRDERRRKLHE